MTRNDSKNALRIAILGGGPRGLAAAEALAAQAARQNQPIALTMIDAQGLFGSGPNYDPGQTEMNLLNIPLRLIDIPCPTHPHPSPLAFSAWLRDRHGIDDPEHYPARSHLGGYFARRWRSLVDTAPPQLSIETATATVTDLTQTATGWMVHAGHAQLGPFDRVLLALGHQHAADGQIEKWQAHARRTQADFLPAYPSAPLLQAAHRWSGRTIAIRGLGLSTIDVLRLLTLGLGGRFDAERTGLVYRPSGQEPRAILPFSRDGIPPAPKPASAEIDALYEIGPEAEARFASGLGTILSRDIDDPLKPLSALLADIATPIAGHLGMARDVLSHWLAIEIDPEAHHPIENRPAAEIMATYLAMAENRTPPSPGYLIGQVWRKLQTPLRKAFNPISISARTAESLVRFDEDLKRFSYGPPPQANRRMLALIAAGLLDLRAVEDPDIVLVADGWRLSGEETDLAASVMIDAVLPPGDLAAVDMPLIAALRERGLLAAAGERLGIATRPDGTVLDRDGNEVEGLAVLGRMATGSVIATDSVHDCFGAAVTRWAAMAAQNPDVR
ncbi:FAD/NAD(P)-binding protein [Pelagibacterium lacus]|nr:FAD/NAD(P)-binding protein [Pelagibacterium lacus]